MNCRKATTADLKVIRELLSASKLPSDDCDEHIENFIVVEDKGKIIGTGGLELCGANGLVRSIAVTPEYRGNGIAREIYRQIEDKAYDSGIRALYLLTESATGYFKKLGFVVKDRSGIPDAIKQTRQFRELCPSSATIMCHSGIRPIGTKTAKT